MTVLNETAPVAQRADLEFVLEQLATLEAMGTGEEEAGCNGCASCKVAS